MVKSLIIVGASSEFSNTFINHAKNSFEIYLISRKEINGIDINNQLLVDDYLNDIDKIKNFINNIKEANVIFFNGFLAENRKLYYPTNNEIRKTALGAEQSVDWAISKNISEDLINLKKIGFEIISVEQTNNSISLENFTPKKKRLF